MMLNNWFTTLVACLFVFAGTVQAQESFPQIETKTFDKEDFVFPDDLNASELNIVLLAISDEQENGEWQGNELVEWYAALDEQGVLNDSVVGWHFAVMKVPFFVKGMIRSGMADTYADSLPPARSGAIFVKDVNDFAVSGGIELDEQPNIVLITPDGQIAARFKGELSEELLADVTQAVSSYQEAAAASE